MIRRTGIEDNVELVCENCGITEDFETFPDAKRFVWKRDNKWVAKRDFDGEWVDLCPECAGTR